MKHIIPKNVPKIDHIFSYSFNKKYEKSKISSILEKNEYNKKKNG